MPTTTRKTSPKKAAPRKPAPPAVRPEVKRLAKFLSQQTQKAFGDHFCHADSKPLSEKAAKIQQYIEENLGSYKKVALELFSLLLEENLRLESEGLSCVAGCQGALVIPLHNPNSHSYTLNRIAVKTADQGIGRLLRPDLGWTPGNNLPETDGDLRLPTEEEILDFAEQNFDELVSHLGVVVL